MSAFQVNLSQAGPPRGICPVCRKMGRLFGAKGLLYRHGPHDHPCPGSGQPPSNAGVATSSQATSSPLDIVPPSHTGNPGTHIANVHMEHPALSGAVLKHVPRAARSTCSAKLSLIIRDICSHPED